jgi:hypothetical protein
VAPRLAIGVLGRAFAGDETPFVVADFEWERFVPSFTASRPSALIRELPEAQPFLRVPTPENGSDGPALLLRQLAGISEADQEWILRELVRRHASTVLGHSSPEDVEPGIGFLELSFSSFTALELRNRLCLATGLQLSPVTIFDHPTLDALAQHLRVELAASAKKQRTDSNELVRGTS